jgi:zinc transport system substrate-binding protein
VVFHDAYQYFEKRFDLKAPGVLTLNPEMAASAKVVQELRVYIQQHNVRCAFREPQFSSAILESLIEGLDVDIGIFDPLGASGVRGVALYPQIIEGMADAFEQCVSRD